MIYVKGKKVSEKERDIISEEKERNLFFQIIPVN